MKMKIFFLSLVSALSFSCSDDMYTPDAAVKATFKSMFPKAIFVDWEMEAGYVNAEFTHDGTRKDAWFETNGTWLMTETDIRSSDIPAAIKNALNQSEYADWRIDDADYLEFADTDPMYVLDMEKGENEVDLYFAADGTLKETKKRLRFETSYSLRLISSKQKTEKQAFKNTETEPHATIAYRHKKFPAD